MRLYACLCVCAWLFLVHGSILFLFTRARRKYYLDCSVLELILWVRYSGVRLHQKPASLSILCLPFSSPHGSGAKMCCCYCFFFWLTMVHTGSPRKRVAVTELSPGCHRWFCAKSAASMDASLEEGWGGWKLCSCHSRDCPCALASRGRPMAKTCPSTCCICISRFSSGLNRGQWQARWFRGSRLAQNKEFSHDTLHKSL